MRRQAWWGGVVAAVALSCADPRIEQVPEEPELLEEETETPTDQPTPIFTPPSNVVLERPTPNFEDPRTRTEPPTVAEVKPVDPTDIPSAEAPKYPTETATPVTKGSANWTFLTSAHGLPPRIFGVSADEGGNLWVAGGNSGVFVMRKGQSRFESYGTPYPA